AVDVYPTIIELCNLQMPYVADGRSLVPLLIGQPGDWKEAAFSYFNRGITLRTARYRLTRYSRDQQPAIELYDHHSDPYENMNVAAQKPEIVKELLNLWEKGNSNPFR